ncbi:hypothetical protein Tco_1335014 [Tanacetum coccineum]
MAEAGDKCSSRLEDLCKEMVFEGDVYGNLHQLTVYDGGVEVENDQDNEDAMQGSGNLRQLTVYDGGVRNLGGNEIENDEETEEVQRHLQMKMQDFVMDQSAASRLCTQVTVNMVSSMPHRSNVFFDIEAVKNVFVIGQADGKDEVYICDIESGQPHRSSKLTENPMCHEMVTLRRYDNLAIGTVDQQNKGGSVVLVSLEPHVSELCSTKMKGVVSALASLKDTCCANNLLNVGGALKRVATLLLQNGQYCLTGGGDWFYVGAHVTKFLGVSMPKLVEGSRKLDRRGSLFCIEDGSIGCFAPLPKCLSIKLRSLKIKLLAEIPHIHGSERSSLDNDRHPYLSLNVQDLTHEYEVSPPII